MEGEELYCGWMYLIGKFAYIWRIAGACLGWSEERIDFHELGFVAV